MATEWDKKRSAQHEAIYPAAQKGERNRLAQARYRERNAKRLKQMRTIHNILMRQSWHAGDFERLGAALRSVLLTRERIAALSVRMVEHYCRFEDKRESGKEALVMLAEYAARKNVAATVEAPTVKRARKL